MRAVVPVAVLVLSFAAIGPERTIRPATQSIRVSAAVPAFEEAALPALVEPWIAVSPANPRHVFVAALLDDFSASVVASSRDGGRTWTRESHSGGARFPGGDPMILAGGDGRARFTTIDPAMRVWVSDAEGGWGAIADVRLHGHANEAMSNKALGGGRLELDRSAGAFRDRRYFVYPDSASGVPRIKLARAGADRAWLSIPVSDGPAGRSESNPAVAVNGAGVVAVTWNDRRDDAADRCYQARIAISRDGGASFDPSSPLGDRPVCPADGRWLNGGDTQGLASLGDNSFIAAWIGNHDGRSRVWTSVITIGTDRQ